MRKLFVGLMSMCLALSCAAFSATASAQQVLPADRAREDFTYLYTTMQAEDIDLFARRSRAEYDTHFSQLLGEIDGPVDADRFHLLVSRLLAFGHVGHAQSDAAVRDVLAYLARGGTIFPLGITFRGREMLTDGWADKGDTMPPGSRVTRIAGLDLASFEERAWQIISADTPRLLRAQLEMGMPIYLQLLFAKRKTLPVAFLRPDGSAGTLDLQRVDCAGMQKLQRDRPVASADPDGSKRSYRLQGDSVFYLHPGPFYALENEKGEGGKTYAIASFARFIDEAFARLHESGASDLLIDLRGNPGGDASFSDLIVSRLVDRPYRFASRYMVRAGPLTKAAWADREKDDTLSGRIAAALARADVGQVVPISLPAVPPAESGHFPGRVFVLVDRHSYSNAAVVAALMQDQRIATIMGEETADLGTTYGAVETFKLPHSGVEVHYPKAYMVRPSGDEGVHGVRPDFPIATNSIGALRDTMLETALVQIARTR